METTTSPTSAPTPSAAAALSPAPAPSTAPLVASPAGRLAASTTGTRGSWPNASLSKSGRYVPVAGDQYPVPLASLRSVANDPPSVAPANFQVSQSCGRQTAAVRAAFAGSSSASHRKFGDSERGRYRPRHQPNLPGQLVTRSSRRELDPKLYSTPRFKLDHRRPHQRADHPVFAAAPRDCSPTSGAGRARASCGDLPTCGSTPVPGGCDDRPSRTNSPNSASRMMTLHVWVDESIPATRVMRPPARSGHAGWVDHWASGFEYPASSWTCASIQPCARRYMAAVRVHVWVNQG